MNMVDGLSDSAAAPGPSRTAAVLPPLPPHLQSLLDNTTDSVTAHHAAVHAAVDEAITGVKQSLDQLNVSVHMPVRSVIGGLDASIRQAYEPVARAVDKSIDTTLRSVSNSLADLSGVGIDAPFTPSQARVMVDDPTGDMVVQALGGGPGAGGGGGGGLPAGCPGAIPLDSHGQPMTTASYLAGDCHYELPDGTWINPDCLPAFPMACQPQANIPRPGESYIRPPYCPPAPTAPPEGEPQLKAPTDPLVTPPPPVAPPCCPDCPPGVPCSPPVDPGPGPYIPYTPPPIPVGTSSCVSWHDLPDTDTYVNRLDVQTTGICTVKAWEEVCRDIGLEPESFTSGDHDVQRFVCSLKRPTTPAPTPAPVPLPACGDPCNLAPMTVLPQSAWASPSPFWSSPTVCADARLSIAQTPQVGPDTPLTDIRPDWWLASPVGAMWATGTLAIDTISDALGIGEKKSLREHIGHSVGESSTGIAMARRLIADAAGPSIPDPGAAGRIGAKLSVANSAERLSGFPLGYLFQHQTYLYQYANPQYIPDQTALDHAYLCNSISVDQWGCLTRAQGNQPESFKWALDSAQLKPQLAEDIALYLRGHMTLPTLRARARELGMLNPGYLDEYLELAKAIPSPGALVTYMVRDVFDPGAVSRLQLDDEFNLKFYGPGGKDAPGPAAKWAAAQGVSEDVFKYEWYAHWKIPSDTALYDMHARLRPDRAEVVYWDEYQDKYGAVMVQEHLGARPVVFTDDDLRYTLKINDLAPSLVDGMIARSYHPINRSDAIQAFLNGAFTEAELYESFRDNNYDEPTARRMVDIQKVALGKRVTAQTGVWTVRMTIQQYERGTIDGVTCDRLLTPLLPDAAQRARAILDADEHVKAQTKEQQIKRFRRALITGAEATPTVRQSLVDIGVSLSRSIDLITQWEAERDGRYKEASAAQILKWITYQVVSVEQGKERLSRLGYIPQDIDRMAALATVQGNDRVGSQYDASVGRKEKTYKSVKERQKATDAALTLRQKQLESQARALAEEAELIRAEFIDRNGPK